MMFDCNFRQQAENEDEEMYDVLADLLDNELTGKKCGLNFLHAFLLTHPDQDHCRSFSEKFYLGSPDAIKDEDKENKKILIGELWYSPRVFEEQTNELNADAKAFKKEASIIAKNPWLYNFYVKNLCWFYHSNNPLKYVLYCFLKICKKITTHNVVTTNI